MSQSRSSSMGVEERPPEPLRGNPKYQKIRSLNKGSYGFVQLAKNRETGEMVAIKFIKRGENVTKYVEREILNHSNLLHPHIIQFKEVFVSPEYLAIVMEYAAGGDMFQYVKRQRGLGEDEARWFFQQLVTGMEYCHKRGVVSRDIKLENTLLDTSKRPLIKICDFGYSKHQNDSLPKSKVGTPGYTAPEIIVDRRSYDGVAADVWSAGVQLYVMLFCQYPFERAEDEDVQEERIQKVLHRIVNVQYSFPSNNPVSSDCKDLIKKILVADPSKRLSIKQIQNHKWYMKGLPPGLKEFNDQCILRQSGAVDPVKVQQIKAILQEAKIDPTANGTSQGASELPSDAYDVDYIMDDVMANSYC